MIEESQLRLMFANTALLDTDIREIEAEFDVAIRDSESATAEETDHVESDFYVQFDESIREEASRMSHHYRIFYAFENSVRNLVEEQLTTKLGDNWWEEAVPESIRTNVASNMSREVDAGVTLRSTSPIDYTTFGELAVIIERNFEEAFDDIFRSRRGIVGVLSRLNVLRGPIAHNSELAEDEVVRLRLSLRDWFRLMS